MLYAEYDPEVEMRVVREDALEEGREEGREEARKEDRQYFLELLNQGLTIDEIKERLRQEAVTRRI
jgi:predicted transposase YdaD